MGTAVFGAPDFKASNGLVVKPAGNGGIEVGQPGYRDYTPPAATFALEEFFQAKRDSELGRWRWPANPHLMVYVDGDRVAVVDERSGDRAHYSRNLCGRTPAPVAPDGLHAAAHAYYEAHPERKPWDDARDGEIWLMKDEAHGDAERAYLAVDGRFFVLPPKRPIDAGWEPAAFASNFTEGERFWPASAEEEEQFIAAMTPTVASSQAGLASIRGGL